MKFKEFNYQNSKAIKKGQPIVGMSQKSGCIRLNKETIELMGISVGDPVVFLQDEENEKDWYLAKKEGGFPVRSDRSGEGNKSFAVNCTKVVKSIAESCEIEQQGFRMQIGSEPITDEKVIYYPIITKSWK